MKRPAARCGFSVSSIIAALIACVAATGGSAAHAADCPETFAAKLGKNLPAYEKAATEALATFKIAADPVPAEVAEKARETLPEFRRSFALDPAGSGVDVLADIYFGNQYKSAPPEVFVLPLDRRSLCLLAPTQGVFLSDGVISHYATIRHVDYDRRTVLLLDPWGSRSFMLKGNNLADVNGRLVVVSGEAQQLELSFDDFLKVAKGLLNEPEPVEFFDLVGRLYPEVAGTETFYFWKFSRLLMSPYLHATIAAIFGLNDLGPQTSPSLRLLHEYANDIAIRVASGFAIDGPGRSSVPVDRLAAKQAFLGRLPAYAKTLPWRLRWNLLAKAASVHDDALTLAISKSFLDETPGDADFRIERARALLRRGDLAGARTEFAAAETSWNAATAATIEADTSDAAVRYFFAHLPRLWSLMTYQDLEWSHMRIVLGQTNAALASGGRIDLSNRLSALQHEYPGNFYYDYMAEVLDIAWVSGEHGAAATFLDSALMGSKAILKDDVQRHIRLAEIIYAHLVVRQSIRDVLAVDPDFPDDQMLREMLCAKAHDQSLAEESIVCFTCDLRDARASLKSDLLTFCR